jgi:DisA bacterial checkpoint controller nucleotide-binding
MAQVTGIKWLIERSMLKAMEFIEERADEAGTRHRAAYRLSRQHPECMIIVVSQDSSVKYVGNPNGRVTYGELGPFKPRASVESQLRC